MLTNTKLNGVMATVRKYILQTCSIASYVSGGSCIRVSSMINVDNDEDWALRACKRTFNGELVEE